MPKHLFKKYLPSPEHIRRNRSLNFLGGMLTDPNLWHINRHSLAGAAFIGIFCALLPIPLQMVVAAVLALRFKSNLPLSVLLVWFTNPFTYVPVFYFTYRVGSWMLGVVPSAPESVNLAWLLEQLIPLWVGSLACGLVGGLMGWATVKLAWRVAVVRSWRKRQLRRQASSVERP